jgi:anhydro-N-acetylmuramic acid kinase
LTAFTAAAVARGVKHMPAPPELWIVCGGGRHNDAIMKDLRARLSGRVVNAEAIDCDGDAIEAEAFAYLAVRSRADLPLSYPDTTGVPSPQTGGILARAN